MPIRETQFVPGCYYHLYNRGAGRRTIFTNSGDYLVFLRRLKEHVATLHVAVIAYCLMPNHYHLLVRQDGEIAAGKLAQLVSNGYAQWFNRRYEHAGTLFEARYKSLHVSQDEYVRHLCRYIHLNPVRHGFADHPSEWIYSNYLEWIGQRPGTLVDRAFVAAWFPRPNAYEEFVASRYAKADDLPGPLGDYFVSLER